jgi:hypothetical protein
MVATFIRVDLMESIDGVDHLIEVVTDEAGDTIDDDLGDRAAP